MPGITGVLDRDLDDLEDIEARVVTEEYLAGRRPWPLGNVLPLKRWHEDESCEVGYVRKASTIPAMIEGNYVPAEPVVYTDGGIVTQRRYASLGQLAESGWRVD